MANHQPPLHITIREPVPTQYHVRADELNFEHLGRPVQVTGHLRHDTFVADRNADKLLDPNVPNPRMWTVCGILVGFSYKPVEDMVQVEVSQGSRNVAVFVPDGRLVTFAGSAA